MVHPCQSDESTRAVDCGQMRLRTLLGVLVVASLVTACFGASKPFIVPRQTPVAETTETPAPTRSLAPIASAAPTRSPAENTALVRDAIAARYGKKPRPSWYDHLQLVDGGVIALALDGTALVVQAKPPITRKLARKMCRDIAKAPVADEGQPIGLVVVHIQMRGLSVADCTVRGS
jgi:hypothetical protein